MAGLCFPDICAYLRRQFRWDLIHVMRFLAVFGTLREDLVDRFTAGLKITIYTHVSTSDHFGHRNFPLELKVGFISE